MKHNVHMLAAGLMLTALLTGSPGAAYAEEPAPHADTHSSVPAQSLKPETLFLMLLAEIAGARGEIQVAIDAYLEIAQDTRDPRLAQRATEIALFARDLQTAAHAAQLWADIDPESEDAQRIFAGVFAASSERLNEVQIQLARILAASSNDEDLAQNLLGLNRALSRIQDKEVVRRTIERLAEPYLSHPEAHFARAQAAAATNDAPGALDALQRAVALRPGWGPALALKAQILLQMDAGQDALEMLEGHLQAQPENRNTRLTYARTLVTVERFEEALDQFRILLAEAPNDRELMYAVALISAQLDMPNQATLHFERALEAGHPDADNIRMNLGRLAEESDRIPRALSWYDGVEPGQHYIDAQLRIAYLLVDHRGLAAARRHLHEIVIDDPADHRRLLFAEVLLLREAGDYAEALALVEASLREEPEDPELLYESAMLAERLDLLVMMESRLRKLIGIDPTHAHAYNALGYTLADRGLRLDEAEELVARALELAPDDPYILDSMGWVHFRQDAFHDALEYLERAYELRADPDIAAHLGETLWALERHDEARQVWDDALRHHPDNATLTETVERLHTP